MGQVSSEAAFDDQSVLSEVAGIRVNVVVYELPRLVSQMLELPPRIPMLNGEGTVAVVLWRGAGLHQEVSLGKGSDFDLDC